MNIGEGMKTITENIITAHHVRVKALGNLVNQVGESLDSAQKTIKDFAADRKAVSKEQAAELARFAGELAGTVGAQLKGFQKELELVAKERVLSAKELKDHLHKEAKDLSNLVAKTLNTYRKDHAGMSEAQRHHLQVFVRHIVKTVGDMKMATQGLMGDYRADIRKAGSAWKDMTRTLAKARAQDKAPIVEGGDSVGTVEGAVPKIHRRRKKSKK